MGINEVQQISIEQLVEDVEMLMLDQGVEGFKITEQFEINGRKSYIVRGLHMGIENDTVYSNDWDDMIYENIYVMKGFLKDSVISIVRTIDGDNRKGKLDFKDGIIIIEVLW
jgi:hypothetical protein